MSSTPSLRDLYNPPLTQWAFVPPNNPTHPWTTRPAFDLPLRDPPSVNMPVLLRSLVASALLQYSSTAIAMPLEVGKLLLQIQWVPRDTIATPPETEEQVEEEEYLSDASNESESYFIEPGVGPSKYPAPKLVDDTGYVIRTSVVEDGTRPEYIIPVGCARSTWTMLNRLVSFQGEGWLAPWKGLLTTCIHDVLMFNIQPLVDSVLTSLFASSTRGFYKPPLWLPIMSHVITGFVLSPLDLVRTRLVAQSSIPRYKTYTGPLHALSEIISNEGGLRGVYFHPHLFIPTILDTGLRAFTHIVLPSLIAPHLGFGPHVAPDSHPIAWTVAEVLAGCFGLLITLPIETVRRRLQVQTRGTAKSLRTCMETRPVPYNGVVDVLWHILTEERSDLPIKRLRRRTAMAEREVTEEENESWLRNTGVGQLYRGIGIRLLAIMIFTMGALGGGEEVDSGWAEL
ncbi:mitochondrial carrier domain-containing protein [Scleroderma yunnanense]